MKTKEEIIGKYFSTLRGQLMQTPKIFSASDVQILSRNIEAKCLEFIEAYHEEKTRWISVEDNSMPKFYEHYLIKLNGTVQHIAYQFVGKEVDEHWFQDDSDPAYWFQADIGNEVYQIEITDSVFYQHLPQN